MRAVVRRLEADALARLAKMLRLKHPPFETFTIRTPRGGRHCYFEGSLPSKVRIAGLKIDTRGRGGDVLVPPSIVDGKPYEWEFDIDIAPLPNWIGNLFKVEPRSPSPAKGEPVTRAQLEARLECIDPDSDYGKWRDIVAAIHATNLVGDEDGKLRLEIAHAWSRGDCLLDRSAEKYDAAHVEIVFYNMPPKEGGVGFGTIEFHARAGGFAGPSAAPRASISEVFAGMATTNRTDNPFDVREEWEMYREARLPEIFPGFMYQRGIGGMAAETQAFKTFNVMGMAMSICSGEPYLGMTPLLTGTVVYATLEDPSAVRGPRRIAWREAHGIGRQRDLPFVTMDAPVLAIGKEAEAFPDAIATAIKGKPPLRLIVLETLNRIGEGYDLNGLDMVRVVGYAERLSRRFNCFVLLVHHKSDKAGAAEAMNSAYFKANLDVLYVVTRTGLSMSGCIYLSKYKNGETGKERYYTATEKAWDAYTYRTPTGAEVEVEAGKSLHLVPKAPSEGERTQSDRHRERLELGAALARLGACGPHKGLETRELAERLAGDRPPEDEAPTHTAWLTAANEWDKRLHNGTRTGKHKDKRTGRTVETPARFVGYFEDRALAGSTKNTRLWFLPEIPE